MLLLIMLIYFSHTPNPSLLDLNIRYRNELSIILGLLELERLGTIEADN